jgi:hypothetical protein
MGNQLPDPGVACNRNEMAQKSRADALSLVGVDHGKSDFGLSRLLHDVASARDNRRMCIFIDDSDQGDMIDEVDVQIKRCLILTKLTADREEPPL